MEIWKILNFGLDFKNFFTQGEGLLWAWKKSFILVHSREIQISILDFWKVLSTCSSVVHQNPYWWWHLNYVLFACMELDGKSWLRFGSFDASMCVCVNSISIDSKYLVHMPLFSFSESILFTSRHPRWRLDVKLSFRNVANEFRKIEKKMWCLYYNSVPFM